jgi:hypothetical protein
VGAEPTSDDGIVEEAADDPIGVPEPPAARVGRTTWLVAAGAALLAAGVGIASMAVGPMAIGWYLFVGAVVVLGWSTAELLPLRLRSAFLVVGGVASIVGLLAWVPSLGGAGSQTWLGWAGLLCLVAPLFPIAVLLGAGSNRLLGERRIVALTVTLVGVALAVLVAQPASLKVRLVIRQPAFDEVAERLLLGEDGRFDGTGHEFVSSMTIGDGPERSVPADLEPVPDVAGMEVVFGRVSSDPRQVRLCLPGTVGWSCSNDLVFAPGQELDGTRVGWNVDCDLVTRHVTGDWYLRSVECPRS